MKNILCHKSSSVKFFCLLAVFVVFFLIPVRATIAATIQETETAITDSLTAAGIDVTSVSISDTNVTIGYRQLISEFTGIDGMLTKIATILAEVSDTLSANYQVKIIQAFDDGQIMEVIGQSEDGQLYLEGSISSAVFQEKLELNPQTRGPMLTADSCNPGQGDNCRNNPACECYPDQTCDPDNPAADEKGCVTNVAPSYSHLSGTQYVCDTGYEWNDDLTACVPETTCPVNAFKFQGECHCDEGYTWNTDKTQCVLLTDLYYPHIASNGRWETEICAINTGSESIKGVFLSYDNNGRSVSGGIEVTLGSHARKEIKVGDEFTDPSDIGYIIFESNSDNVVGYTKFFIDGQYRVAVPAVSEITTGYLYISHIASNDKWWTGVSLVNTESTPTTLNFKFNTGVTKQVKLAGYEHTKFTIKSLFDNTPQTDLDSAIIKDADGVVGLELFGSANKLSGILLKSDIATEMYYPHIASNDRWWTGIVAYNPSDSRCTLNINPYTAEGTALTPQEVDLNGYEKYIGTISALGLPTDSSWFYIKSTQPVTGFELFGTSDNKLLAGYTGVNISGTDGIFAKIDKEGWTGIAFVNIGSSPAHVALTAYNDLGNVIATESVEMTGYAKMVDNPEKIFSHDINNATYITYSSDQKLVGFQLNGSSDNMMLDGLPGLPGLSGDNNNLQVTKKYSADEIFLKDAYVYEYPYRNWNNANWGGSTQLMVSSQVDGLTNTDARVYLKFDIDALQAEAASIDKAELVLDVYDGNSEFGETKLEVFRVLDEWGEGDHIYHSGQDEADAAPGTVSWSNQPGVDLQTPWSSENISKGAGPFSVSFDITELLKSWLDGTYSNYGILIKGQENSTYRFYFPSSETVTDGTSFSKPSLVLYTSSASSNLRTVTLTSPKDSSSIDECSYSFVRNAMESNPNLGTYDILLESWCVDNAAFCGNFADIGVVDIATVNSYPSSGYIKDCTDDWDISHTFISQNRDGSHTVFKITRHAKLDNCQHVVDISYRNLD